MHSTNTPTKLQPIPLPPYTSPSTFARTISRTTYFSSQDPHPDTAIGQNMSVAVDIESLFMEEDPSIMTSYPDRVTMLSGALDRISIDRSSLILHHRKEKQRDNHAILTLLATLNLNGTVATTFHRKIRDGILLRCNYKQLLHSLDQNFAQIYPTAPIRTKKPDKLFPERLPIYSTQQSENQTLRS